MNKIIKFVLIVSAGVAFIGLAIGWYLVHGSLAQLDGKVRFSELKQPVAITRDAAGVPSIMATDRLDAVTALGFLHAQDRYFEMDLARRHAAGRLAELLGPVAVAADRTTRIYELDERAKTIVAQLSVEEKQFLEHYTAGVNAGLNALPSRPLEYLLLRARPEPWRPEDIILTLYAMALDLQDTSGRYALTLQALHDTIGEKAYEFFAPLGGPADAPLDDSALPAPPLPKAGDLSPAFLASCRKPTDVVASLDSVPSELGASNSFAVAAWRMSNGRATIGGSIHSALQIPNIWYRAEIHFPNPVEPASDLTLVGITLPGFPCMITGSNGDLAWELTNAHIATTAVVLLEPAGKDGEQYMVGGVPHQYEEHTEVIRVKGARSIEMKTQSTIWGPVHRSSAGRRYALRWSLEDVACVNLEFLRLEQARDVAEAINVAKRCGTPALNITVADKAGHIGWTICGRVPRRVGWDGRLPVSWSDGTHRWDGYYNLNEIPEVIDPPQGIIWTANNRILGGASLYRLGDGGFDRGGRAKQIRDDLLAIKDGTAADLLEVDLDDRAKFLARWQEFLLQLLDPAALALHPDRTAFRRLVEQWGQRASAQSVGYYLVRSWRNRVIDLAFAPVAAYCTSRVAEFDSGMLPLDQPIWTLLHEQPSYLLNTRFHSWNELMLGAVDEVIARSARNGKPMTELTWGRQNMLRLTYRLTRSLPPWIARFANFPSQPQAGDFNMPRVQTPSYGASERIVVAPGDERNGIFEMPGGESGNPFSPYYRADLDDWVRGVAAQLLPRAEQHRLVLHP